MIMSLHGICQVNLILIILMQGKLNNARQRKLVWPKIPLEWKSNGKKLVGWRLRKSIQDNKNEFTPGWHKAL